MRSASGPVSGQRQGSDPMTLAALKPRNQARLLPTVSFSLPAEQRDRLREIAWARDVSLSQVARDALDLALARWDDDEAPGPASASNRIARPPRPIRWPRDVRRRAAREGV